MTTSNAIQRMAQRAVDLICGDTELARRFGFSSISSVSVLDSLGAFRDITASVDMMLRVIQYTDEKAINTAIVNRLNMRMDRHGSSTNR